MSTLFKERKDGCWTCGQEGHFSWECPKWIGGGPQGRQPLSESEPNQGGGTQAGSPPISPPILNPEPLQCWCSPQNVTDALVEGKECQALLDSGAQCCQITMAYVKEHQLLVFPNSLLQQRGGWGLYIEGVRVYHWTSWVLSTSSCSSVISLAMMRRSWPL